MIVFPANEDRLISFFPICSSLLSLSSLVALARNFSMVLKGGGKRGQLRLAPDLSGTVANFSPLGVLLAVGFL